jgi:hypothetical protein
MIMYILYTKSHLCQFEYMIESGIYNNELQLCNIQNLRDVILHYVDYHMVDFI